MLTSSDCDDDQAEAEYLGSVLDAGVPPRSPIHQQAQRYLKELERNSSWTFAQKRLVVQARGCFSFCIHDGLFNLFLTTNQYG